MSQRLRTLQQNAPKGVGLGLRPALWDSIIKNAENLDLVEIMLDDFLALPLREAKQRLQPIRQCLPIIAHGIHLSIGSADGIDQTYVEKVARFLDLFQIEVYSEHLSFLRIENIELEQFVPIPFTDRWVEIVCNNIKKVQQITGRTLILENVSYLLGHPFGGLGEASFLSKILSEADCGLLLDITNLLTNGANLQYFPINFLDQIPLERIVYTHLAGGHIASGFYIDSHSQSIQDETFNLLAQIASQTPALQTVIIERDKNFPTFDKLLLEVSFAKQAIQKNQPFEISENICLPSFKKDVSKTSFKVDTDLVSAKTWQKSLAMLLSKYPLNYMYQNETKKEQNILQEEAGPYLLSFAKKRVRMFCKILSRKRRDKISPHLPGLFLSLSEQLPNLLTEYFCKNPEQGKTCIDETLLFTNFILDHPTLGEAQKALALHEKTVFLLETKQKKFWHTPRKVLFLRYDPKKLSLVKKGAPLPEKLSHSLKVTYYRKKQGIFVIFKRPDD